MEYRWAWMQYVPVPSPTSSSFIDGNTPYSGLAAGGNIAGITAYGYWNQLLYVEFGGYGTANGLTSFMSAGVPDDEKTQLQGTNPYWRVALSHFWGANNIMVGTSGMSADVYDDPLDTSDPNSTHHLKDIGFDSQYQYLLDPHSVTAQLAYVRNKHSYPGFLANQPVEDVNGNPLPDTNANDTTKVLRAKVSYVYGAKYGGSLAHFNQASTTNSALYDPARVFGNVSVARISAAGLSRLSGFQSSTFASAPSTRATANSMVRRTITMASGVMPATTIHCSSISGERIDRSPLAHLATVRSIRCIPSDV